METGLEQTQQLGRFLADVERRAYRIAVVALRDRDDALDVVQGAMLRLVRSYRKWPSDEWRPVFYRILSIVTARAAAHAGEFPTLPSIAARTARTTPPPVAGDVS